MSKLLVAPGSDPYINLAAESLLLREAAEPTLYLWVNSPSVIVGVNQNILKEADAEYLRSNGVSVVRRTTGGGAVYHDLGNLNYSFIIPNSIYSVERQNRVISDALRKFSVEAHFSGRNDLVVGVRKVGGAAYKKSVPNSLHHGTLLVNLDIGAATAALTPAPEKLESKGVDSVKSRIANLSEFSDAVNVATLSAALIEAFGREYGDYTELAFPRDRCLSEAARLASEDWLYGREPPFSHEMRFVINGERIAVRLDFREGRIVDVSAVGDFLDGELPEKLRPHLIGKSLSEIKGLPDLLESLLSGRFRV